MQLGARQQAPKGRRAAAAAPATAIARRPPPLQQRRPDCAARAGNGAAASCWTVLRQPQRRNMQRLGVQCNGAPPRVQQQEAVQAQVLQPGVVAGAPQAAPNGNGDNQQPEADTLIEFRNVWKSFGSKHILRGASFKIRRGEAVGIIGSSGTGKSTTLRLAAGLLEPDRGEVLIKGEPRRGLISDDDTSDKLKVGLVFQSGALFDSLTVGQNVGFLLHEHTNLPAAKIKELVAESLGKVGLTGVEALYPSELSGGMKKRVALARAIVRDEKHDNVEQVIMYDEPTAGLDPVASTVVEDLIRELHEKHGEGHHHPQHAPQARTRGKHIGGHRGSVSFHAPPPAALGGDGNGATATATTTATAAPKQACPGGVTSYVVVTHQHSTIRRAVDRIIFLHQGRVVWEGSVEEFDTTDEPIVRQFASGSLEGPIRYE